jgi:cell division ATPase FtsA
MVMLRIKQQKLFLVFDIGTEALKVIVLKRQEKEPEISENYLHYFDDDDIIYGKLAALQKIGQRFSGRSDNVVFGLPADICRGRVLWQTFERKNPKQIIDEKEERVIHRAVFEKAKEEISHNFWQKFGILPQDLKIVNIKVIETMIDGYQVPTLQKYDGEKLVFRIWASFLPEHYFKEFDGIFQTAGFKNRKIVHQAEGLTSEFGAWLNGIFLDVGGEATQIFLTYNGKLSAATEFGMGGKIFSETISEKLGLREKDARIFKQKYAQNQLTLESSQRVKEIFYFPQRSWFENLKAKLKEIKDTGLFPSSITLFGGTSLLPEIKEVLEEGDWGNIVFVDTKPEVKISKDPQFLPALLMSSQI